MAHSAFSNIALAPRDPILGVTEAFIADPRPGKVNLGVGVYHDENGRLPLLACVRAAEQKLTEAAQARGYLPIDGLKPYDAAVQQMLFGAKSPLLDQGRVVTVQALGGTGALKIGADFLAWFVPPKKVLISNPSWENHRALFEAAGYEVTPYAYYEPATRGFDREGMMAALDKASTGTVVVLHACCHNPTGVDLEDADWDRVVDIVRRRELVAFLDIAYQGFGAGIDEDAVAVRKFSESGLPFLVASSFSKSFSLYGERVGALSVVCADKAEADRVLSQLKRVVRTNYSNPPTHGASLVATVLGSPEGRQQWEDELGTMRERIRAMRQGLRQRLEAALPGQDFSYVTRQRGMFSYTGLTPAQVDHMREHAGVHSVASGRICVASINLNNIDAVAGAIASAIKAVPA